MSTTVIHHQIIVTEEAQSDISDAAVWYEHQRRGWGEVFSTTVLATLQKIARTPETYPVINDRVRRANTHRFPFGVYFLVEEQQIVVIAVVHASRDPETWQRRTTE